MSEFTNTERWSASVGHRYIPGEMKTGAAVYGKPWRYSCPARAVTYPLTQQSLWLLSLWEGERAQRQRPVRRLTSESVKEAGCRGANKLSHASHIKIYKITCDKIIFKWPSNLFFFFGKPFFVGGGLLFCGSQAIDHEGSVHMACGLSCPVHLES